MKTFNYSQKTDPKFILCGGKGGGVKTLCAAGKGLHQVIQRSMTLVRSEDSAHSLAI